MASQSTGIQQLLAAEKKAAEKVADARKSNLFPIVSFSYFNAFKLLGYVINKYLQCIRVKSARVNSAWSTRPFHIPLHIYASKDVRYMGVGIKFTVFFLFEIWGLKLTAVLT